MLWPYTKAVGSNFYVFIDYNYAFKIVFGPIFTSFLKRRKWALI
jgi:hypothetical protein